MSAILVLCYQARGVVEHSHVKNMLHVQGLMLIGLLSSNPLYTIKALLGTKLLQFACCPLFHDNPVQQ